jgi:hypothetical protein
MNAVAVGAITRDAIADQPKSDIPLDAAWLVLEAANDLCDQATVEICRRVIDAGLNGRPAAPSDLQVLHNYFS